MSVNLPRANAAPDNVALGKRRLAIWVLSGGLYTGATYKTVYGALLPDIQNMDAPTASPINEREHYEMGFKPSQINDGVDWAFTIEVEGAAREMPAWLIGQLLSDNVNMKFGRDYGTKGHLIVYTVDENEVVQSIEYLLDVGVKLMQLPAGANSENNLTIDLYVKDGVGGSVWGGNPVAFEFFVDNANDANADAPDASITAFVLGHGNRSYSTAAPPDILEVDPAATGLARYFLWVRLDGRDVTDAEATFNASTKTLTFATAPGAGSMLEMGYLVDKAGVGVLGQPPHLWAGSSFLNTPKVFMS